jgi:hypothetical protein
MVDIRNICHFMVIFLFKFCPLETSEKVMYAWVGLVHLSYTESAQSETRSQLSQGWARLHVDWSLRSETVRRWVNSECTNIYAEFIIPCRLTWPGVSFRVDSLDLESQSLLTQLTWSLIPCWLSWPGVSFCVDSVDLESHSVLTQLTWSLIPCWLSW